MGVCLYGFKFSKLWYCRKRDWKNYKNKYYFLKNTIFENVRISIFWKLIWITKTSDAQAKEVITKCQQVPTARPTSSVIGALHFSSVCISIEGVGRFGPITISASAFVFKRSSLNLAFLRRIFFIVASVSAMYCSYLSFFKEERWRINQNFVSFLNSFFF